MSSCHLKVPSHLVISNLHNSTGPELHHTSQNTLHLRRLTAVRQRPTTMPTGLTVKQRLPHILATRGIQARLRLLTTFNVRSLHRTTTLQHTRIMLNTTALAVAAPCVPNNQSTISNSMRTTCRLLWDRNSALIAISLKMCNNHTVFNSVAQDSSLDLALISIYFIDRGFLGTPDTSDRS